MRLNELAMIILFAMFGAINGIEMLVPDKEPMQDVQLEIVNDDDDDDECIEDDEYECVEEDA